MKSYNQIKVVMAGLYLSCLVVPVAMADDTEIYTRLSDDMKPPNPNIMFVVDTSGSMNDGSHVKPFYDYTVTYPAPNGDAITDPVQTGVCKPDAVYFTDTGDTPDCTSENYFNFSALVCHHTIVQHEFDKTHATTQPLGPLLRVGTYSDQMAQYDDSNNRWRSLAINHSATDRDYLVECFSDSGHHGAAGGNQVYITDGTVYTSTAPIDPENPHPVWSGGDGHLQLFTGNYLNYLNWEPNPDPDVGEVVWESYIEQVKAAVEILVRGNTQVDIGLMRFDRFSSNGNSGASEGGPVMYPILDVGASRNDFFTRLSGLDAEGGTPLSETYYEALLYFGGKEVDYGDDSNPSNQVGTTNQGSGGTTYYDSPITGECDKNYIVVLSDGKPTLDTVNTNSRLSALTGFDQSSCDDITDNCLDELAGWAFTHDVAEDSSFVMPDGSRPHDGEQHITTHTVSFKLPATADGAEARALMMATAAAGDGDFYEANNQQELVEVFNNIISTTLKVNSTFSSPAVSVNAFNRSTHLDDLYFTLFKPGDGNHWDGNLKKYKLDFFVDTADSDADGDTSERLPFIADQDGAHAVDDTTGFFSVDARSIWSAEADGKEVSQGGAVSRLAASRRVYTYTGNYTVDDGVYVPATTALVSSSNEVNAGNDSITDAMLNIVGLDEIVDGTPYRDTLLNWASGLDALSKFGDPDSYDDMRPQMGDPLHSEPALVQYGGTLDTPEMVAYVATNDGYIHAFDTSDGSELFSFIPRELLPKLRTVMENDGGSKSYGLDGNVVAWVEDVNHDGRIVATDGDRVVLYVSMRRGGRNIYALDVTLKASPQLLWVIKGGNGDYEELGDTWSSVNVEKIKDGTIEKTVLIFGGGYDDGQDASTVRSTDSVGRAIFIVDAESGERLWSGGANGDVTISNMDYSIPARVKPLDISGNGYVDRIYAVDMGGQVFRFDINNTDNASLSASIIGGRIADLAGATAEDARRFYYPPDVALVDGPDGKFHALVLSSGFRAHPLYKGIHDRIYMLKDRRTGLITDAANYTTLVETDLKDVSDNLAGGDGADDAARDAELANIESAEGWYIDLEDENNPGTWLGEKGLSEPLMLEGVAILSTYTPPDASQALNSCTPPLGVGKVYFLDILDATPAYPISLDARSERHMVLKRGGIPPTPNVIITKGGEPTLCVGTECSAADLGLGVRKTYWYEVEK